MATSLNEIGLCYRHLSDPDRALKYYKNSFLVYRTLYGDTHLAVATSVNNIGIAYRDKNALLKSLKYHKEAFRIRKELLEENHPDVQTSLACIESVQAQLALGSEGGPMRAFQDTLTYCFDPEASSSQPIDRLRLLQIEKTPGGVDILPVLEEVLDEERLFLNDSEEVSKGIGSLVAEADWALPQDHAKDLVALPNIVKAPPMPCGEHSSISEDCGTLNLQAGRVECDRDLLADVIHAEGPTTATSATPTKKESPFKDDKAFTHTLQHVSLGKADCHETTVPVESLVEDLTCPTSSGPGDPWGDQEPSAASHIDLAHSYVQKGLWAQAIGEYHKALEIQWNTLGVEHLSVAASLSNLGSAYQLGGHLSRALTYHEECLAIRKKVLDTHEHPLLVISLNNVGTLQLLLGQYDSALQHFEEGLAITKAIHGDKHVDVATFLHNMGIANDKKKRWVAALLFYQESLRVNIDILGKKHPKVVERHVWLQNNRERLQRTLHAHPTSHHTWLRKSVRNVWGSAEKPRNPHLK